MQSLPEVLIGFHIEPHCKKYELDTDYYTEHPGEEIDLRDIIHCYPEINKPYKQGNAEEHQQKARCIKENQGMEIADYVFFFKPVKESSEKQKGIVKITLGIDNFEFSPIS